MADALVSPGVAAGAAAISAGLLALSAYKLKKSDKSDLVPLMGVMGAFVFAAQMINFSIPGTGSSGHIVGGILLAAMLGPWGALLTLASVLVVQCLVFADGGLMALGCNILNMGVCTTLIAYPLIYKPLMKPCAGWWRTCGVSLLACVAGLELGALLVTAETEMSGITALSSGKFLALMTSIHFFIGLGEGLATAAVVYYVSRNSPALLANDRTEGTHRVSRHKFGRTLAVLSIVAVALAATAYWIASSDPDGLEWSILNMTGATDVVNDTAMATRAGFESAQNTTSFLPDYDSTWAGIIGCLLVVGVVWALTIVIGGMRTHRSTVNDHRR